MRIVIIGVLLCLLGVPTVQAETSFSVPEGFELQRLDVTEGRIAKPKGWFYDYGTDKNSIMWTISKEDSKKGPYKTGLRIQFIPAVSRAAQTTPQLFVEQFLADKKKTEKVVRDCPSRPAGVFARVCLETLESADSFGPDIKFHTLYSLFWSNEKDAIVFTIFMTPESNWEEERHNADQMAEFELLGENLWKKK